MRGIVVDYAPAAQSLAMETACLRCRRENRHAGPFKRGLRLGKKHRAGWRQMKLLCLILSGTLNHPEYLKAQPRPIRFEHISLEQGLSQNSVNCILQDHQGFMWFGTQDGLNRYDGHSFTVYKHDELDSNSLSDNFVWTIYEDTSTPNTLWIGTHGGGLSQFDRANERFTHFVNDPKNPHSLSHNDVQSIYADSAGTLWVGTDSGLNQFDRSTGHVTRFINDPENPHSLSHDDVRSIYEDRSGALWIGTGSGLNQFNRPTGYAIRFVNDPKNPYSLSDNNVTAICEDHAGALWIGTDGSGLNRFDRATGHFTRFINDPKDPHSLSHNRVLSIFEDAGGTLWIGTWGGLNKLVQFNSENGVRPYDPTRRTKGSSGPFTRFVNDPVNSHSLSYNVVSSIYADRSGTLWIGTWAGGVNKFDRGQEQFTHVASDPINPHSLRGNSVRSILEDHAGTLWIGTDGALNQFDRNQRRFAYFVNDPNDPHSLSNSTVRSIYEDHTGTLWIGTDGGGLNRFDRDRRQFTHFVNDPTNPHSLSGDLVRSIYEDRAGTLWIGTEDGGLNEFNRDTEQFIRFVNDPLNPHTLSSNRVRFIQEDRAGMLWIGTWGGGLNRFDRSSKQFARFVNDPTNPRSLSHNAVFSICEDHSGALWIGTYGGGLNQFDRDREQFEHYTEKEGLPNEAIYSILEDGRGCLWMSTNKGLSRFDSNTKTFRNYDVSDGLQSNEFNGGASYKSKSGEMFFGGINGFNAFYPDHIQDNPLIPPVVITAFKRYNTGDTEGVAIEEKGMPTKHAIELTYKDNILSFEFAALSFRRPERNQYAYKLEGFNDSWIQLGTKRDVTFTNLDPGDYVLRVKGSNNDGRWNEVGTALKITIAPPSWRTGWAYAIYVGLLLVGLFATDRVQRRRVIHQERVKAEIREAVLRAQAAEAQAQVVQTENERKKNVELLSEIGKEITASLDMETIFYKLYEHVNQLADASSFAVGIYHPERHEIQYTLAIENGKRYAPFARDTRNKQQFSVWCIEHRQPVFINDVATEYGRYISQYEEPEEIRLEDRSHSGTPQAMIYLPLIAQDRVLGVITIQSFHKHAYTDYHLNILQNLAAYTSIALDNADAYRQLHATVEKLNATLDNLTATQQQLVTQEKMASLGQLTAGIAHEIKNPLNFVNNFALLSVGLVEELREELEANRDKNVAEIAKEIEEILTNLQQNAAKITEHGRRADNIVRSMLRHSRGKSGQRELTDINALLAQAVNLAYHGLRAQDTSFNVTIEEAYDPAIEALVIVPQDMSRVFINLINNALDAAHEKEKVIGDGFSPTLSVRTRNLGDQIEIRIRDNGNGIPAEIQDRVFDPFFTTKPAGQGTGLGLSISHELIVQVHQGDIKVETEVGRFTEFIIHLPTNANERKRDQS